LPVVSIEDLVELKKTNRPGDYDVITRLALIRVGREESPSKRTLAWAVRNVFAVEDLQALVRTHGARMTRAVLSGAPAARLLCAAPGGRTALHRAARLLAAEATRLQHAGRSYWLPRLHELRVLRASGRLLPEGAPVHRGLGEA
jgi:hypothetical protein